MKRIIIALFALSACSPTVSGPAKESLPPIELSAVSPTSTTTTTVAPTTTLPPVQLTYEQTVELARAIWGQCGEWHDLALEVGWPESECLVLVKFFIVSHDVLLLLGMDMMRAWLRSIRSILIGHYKWEWYSLLIYLYQKTICTSHTVYGRDVKQTVNVVGNLGHLNVLTNKRIILVSRRYIIKNVMTKSFLQHINNSNQ